MIRLIASDLDETLLNPADKKVGKKNLEAIWRAQEQGVIFVPCSGRGYPSIQGTLEELGTKGKAGQYIISYNGGAITENAGNRLLHFHGLTYEKISELYKVGVSYDLCMHVYTQTDVYIYKIDEDEKAFLKGRMEYIPYEHKDLEVLKDETFAKILFECTDVPFLNRVEKEMEYMTGDLDVSYSSKRYLEFNPLGVNKGSGLVKMAEILNIPIEETLAIGDNINDLAMLQAAGTSACVANALDEIKAVCDYTSKASCWEGGVAEIIETLVLHP